MARPRQVLSLLSRVGALSVSPSASIISCRLASRGANKAWTGQSHVHRDRKPNRTPRNSDEMSDDELQLEDVEDKLQALVDEGRKRQRIVKYHILRRKMTSPGAPQRKLTWDAIEQIRYLRQEQPDEWTVERLAEGFSVTPDVVLRILRSKFDPGPERKAKQDAKVMPVLNRQMLPLGAGTGQGRLKLPRNHTPAALPPGSREGAVVPVSKQTLMVGGEGSGSLAKTSPAAVAVMHTQLRAGFIQDVPVTRSTEEDSTNNVNSTEDKEDEESWDGWVFTDEELEEFIGVEKSSPVVQVGKDFFDAEGDFLYRI